MFAPRKVLAGFGVTAAAVAATTTFVTPAQAASDSQAWVDGSVVVFVAAKGRANSLTVTRSGRIVTIDDKFAIKPFAGCSRARSDKTKVNCKTSGTATEIDVWLEDKNDKLTNKTNIAMYAEGGAGNDALTGGSRADIIRGDTGNDTLTGGAGADVLIGGTGADTMRGGAGLDAVSYYERKKSVVADLDGAKGDDGERGEKDTIGTDVENLEGGKGADTLTGNGAANRIWGGPGNDALRGSGGGDILTGEEGADTMSGGAGSDMVTYWGRTSPVTADLDGEVGDDGEWGEGDTITADVEELEGGQSADTLIGDGQDNFLRGGPGNDVLNGAGGDDTLAGEQGGDTVAGGAGDDWVSYFEHTKAVTVDLDGASGDDGEPGEGDTVGLDIENVEGGKGADTLVGDAGSNGLLGGPGSDKLNGAGGNDYLDGEAGADVLSGGDGNDVVSYFRRTKPVTADLTGTVRNDGEKGEGDTIVPDVESLRGGTGADTLTGSAVDNYIWGGPGNDVIRGGDGEDMLVGSTGNDRLTGDGGDDDVFGEPGTTPATNPDAQDRSGSDAARDQVDGGANTVVGDGCFVRTAGTTANCEHVIGAPQPASRAGFRADAVPAPFSALQGAGPVRSDVAGTGVTGAEAAVTSSSHALVHHTAQANS